MKLIEELADVSHDIWSHWMRYQFSLCTQQEDGSMVIPADRVERWQRQMETPYSELSEQEQESDKEQARKIFNQVIGPREADVAVFLATHGMFEYRFTEIEITNRDLKSDDEFDPTVDEAAEWLISIDYSNAADAQED